MHNDTKYYETIIENLLLEKTELENKVNVLYKLCKKLEEYINEHNLFDEKIEIANSNGKQINSLKEFENIMYLKIPKAVYVVNNKLEKE